MAEQKETQKILCEDLSQAEKVLLTQTTLTPGFKVLEKIANAACLRAQQDTIKLDPESPDYERKCVERQRRARNITEFSDLLLKSIYAHAESIKRHDVNEDKQAEDAVGQTFGIHSANKGVPIDAIKKTFGIHPAKPKK